MAGRRVALSSLAQDPVEEVPGHSTGTPIRLAPDRIARTPLNKRTSFGTPDELTELGESIRRRQLAAVVVVTRARYLALFPEHQDQVGTANYVLVNGERRWRAATQVQLPRLDAVIREDLADSRADLLDAVIAENIDRKNLDPIEEARSVEDLVAEAGSAAAAAKQLHRTEGWVSQRRALLRLTPEIQARVQAGEVPVRIARSIASLPPEDQEAALKDAVDRQSAERAARHREPRRRTPENAPDQAGVGTTRPGVRNGPRPGVRATGPGTRPGRPGRLTAASPGRRRRSRRRVRPGQRGPRRWAGPALGFPRRPGGNDPLETDIRGARRTAPSPRRITAASQGEWPPPPPARPRPDRQAAGPPARPSHHPRAAPARRGGTGAPAPHPMTAGLWRREGA